MTITHEQAREAFERIRDYCYADCVLLDQLGTLAAFIDQQAYRGPEAARKAIEGAARDWLGGK